MQKVKDLLSGATSKPMGSIVRNFLPTEDEIIALITEGQERAVQELAASEKSVKR